MTDIFEYAKKLERDSENLFRDLAAKCFETSVAELFTRLADEEANHYRVVEEMSRGVYVEQTESSIIDYTRNIIEEYIKDKAPTRRDILESEALLMAMDLETKSWEFYEEQARKTEDENKRGIFLDLALQERMHYETLEEMRDFGLS